ncbi:MAG TPA: hypothetical protein VEH10_03330, partial [Thermoplasmata archaeon]|nr:hypothetical protein [Thermoplasmata archaeon]
MRACITWSFNLFSGFTFYYAEFYESWTEHLTATLNAGAGGFSENTFNSEPSPLGGGQVAEWNYFLFTVTLDLYLSIEYNLSLSPNAGLDIVQGTTGWADQNYSFGTSSWTDTNSPLACTGGESTTTGCATIIPSSTTLGSNAEVRVGPEASVTGSFSFFGFSVASLTAWVFLYGQLSLFSGQGPVASDPSGGDCGSSWTIAGMPSTWALENDYWLAACLDVGLQYGASWSALSGAFSGTIYVSAPYVLWAGPVLSTVNVFDTTLNRATEALRFANPVTPDPSFTMEAGTTDTLEVISPLSFMSSNSVGGTWGSPSCGTITPVASTPSGMVVTYTAPGSPGTCQLSVTSGLLFGVAVPLLQIDSVTFDINVAPTFDYQPHVTLHWAGQGCWPVWACVGAPFLLNGSWSLTLHGQGSLSNLTYVVANPSYLTLPNVSAGNYSYLISPLPGLTPVGGVSGELSVSGQDQFLNIDFARLAVIFQEKGLQTGARWGVEVDGVTMNSTTSSLEVNATPGKLTYRINGVQGYYVTPSNTSSVTLNSTDVVVPVQFTVNRTSSPPPPAAFPVQFLPAGLPAGELWSVTLFPGVTKTGPDPTFELANGTYNFSVLSPQGFSTGLGAGQIVVNGANTPPTLIPFAPVTYPVTVGAFGLPSGTSWSATIDGTNLTTTGTTMVFDLPNGSYPYSVTPVPGYTASLSGVVDVAGSGASVSVYFTPVLYAVLVSESGLPVGTPFTATVGGQPFTTSVNGSTSALVWQEFNGSYKYQVTDPAGWTGGGSGTVVVAGKSVILNTTFVPSGKPYYKLTFKEKGLPKNGTYWSVVLANSTLWSNSTKAVFSVQNGVYAWTVPAIPGYAPVTKSGSVTIHGGSKTVTVK